MRDNMGQWIFVRGNNGLTENSFDPCWQCWISRGGVEEWLCQETLPSLYGGKEVERESYIPLGSVCLFRGPTCSATFCLVTLWGKYIESSRGVGTEWDCSKTNLWIIVDDPLKLLGSSSVSKWNKSANFWLRNCTYSFMTHFIGHFLCLE